ncbi:MAG: hypothetical protein WA982_15450 [Rubrobacteraceae bacterium]
MTDDRRNDNSGSRSNDSCSRRGGGGCGCAFPLVVLVVGIILWIFGTNLGIGLSARVPFTESNLTVAGSVGSKEMAIDTLPNYAEQKIADNNNFINQSITLTIGPAEGISLVVLGKQEGAPVVDLHLDAESR